VFGAIDDVNQLLPVEHKLAKSTDESILGNTAVLDSMGLVNLIAAIEDRIAAELGVTLSLVGRDDRRGTFKTVGTLVDYISQVLAARPGQFIR